MNILLTLVLYCNYCYGYHPFEKEDIGTLPGDVQNWAMLIQNYILQVGHQLYQWVFFCFFFKKTYDKQSIEI